jgi:hypothetical protein
MDTGTAVRVTYWAEQRAGQASIYDLEGIEDFRRELAERYVSVVQGRPGDLGGLHQFFVEIVSSISLADLALFLAQGVAFDLIKLGTKAFILRPFLAAYRALRDRNKTLRVDIEECRIVFQDSTVILYKICDDSIFVGLEQIPLTLARKHSSLLLASGERPEEIHVPVFEDQADDRLCRFRVLLDVDETIQGVDVAAYLRYWGAEYIYSHASRVYDVEKDLLLDTEFYTRRRYWAEWDRRRRDS